MGDMPQDATGRNTRLPLPGEHRPDEVFARRLRELRLAAELTQQELALGIGTAGHKMHQTTIAKIEAGDRPVSVGEAVAFARVLSVDLADLVSEPVSSGDQQVAAAVARRGASLWKVTLLRGQIMRTDTLLEIFREELAEAQEQFAHAEANLEKFRKE